jgi:MFS family permease
VPKGDTWRNLHNELHDALRQEVRARSRRRQGGRRDATPSAGLVDSQALRGADTVGASTRGFDAAKRVNGRKRHMVTDTLGLLSGRFWLVATMLGLLMFAASAPSPLYGVYAAKWHFSSTTLTAVFAVYAVALLATLVVTGRLSDHIGRRPVIAAGLLVEAASMACLIAAHSVALLYVAMVLQGLATGAITGALSAALVDLQPDSSSTIAGLVNSATPGIGLATGALVTGALAQYGPAPTHLVYWLLLGMFVVGVGAVIAMAEPGTRRPGALASLSPKLGVPRQARGAFASTLPCLDALWALGGFYLSLGPTLARELLGHPTCYGADSVIFLVTGVGAAAAIVWRSITPAAAMLAGTDCRPRDLHRRYCRNERPQLPRGKRRFRVRLRPRLPGRLSNLERSRSRR